MISTLNRLALRSLSRRPLLSLLSVASIALGVAVVVSVDLANQSARKAFLLSAEALSGKSTHALVGSGGGVPDGLYADLRKRLPSLQAAPIIEGALQLASIPGRTFQVLGVDPFAEASFRAFISDSGVSGPGSSFDLKKWFLYPSALLSPSVAKALNLSIGNQFEVRIHHRTERLTLVGVIDAPDPRSRQALENVILTDVSTAQELLEMPSTLTRIDLILPSTDGSEHLLNTLAGILPPGVEMVRASSRAQSLDDLTAAFRLNLVALSLLALLVGTFLIFNTMTFSVVQRRPVIGILRALGVSKAEIARVVLLEALGLGVVGTCLGIAVGIVLGRGLVHLVSQTINDLYFRVEVRQLSVEPFSVAKGVLLGMGATLLAALPPIREAVGIQATLTLQRSYLETNLRGAFQRAGLSGVLLVVLGVLTLAYPSRQLAAAFAGLFAILVGCALCIPWITRQAIGLISPLMSHRWAWGSMGRMAAGGVVTSLSRTGVAMAALSIALATTVGVGLMVRSFRSNVASWLETSLVADIYISPGGSKSAGRAAGIDSTLAQDLVEDLKKVPGVESMISVRSTRTRWKSQEVSLVVSDWGQNRIRPYQFVDRTLSDLKQLWSEFDRGSAVIISEPFAYRHRLSAGETLDLSTDRGIQNFRIIGVYRDFSSEAGSLLISRPVYERYFNDRALSGVGIFVAPGYSVDAVISSLQKRVDGAEITLRSNRALLNGSLEVFDRTFTITQVLRLLSMGVAFVGVLSAMMAVQVEKTRELAVLRAIGLSPGQIWKLITLETGLMGILSGLFCMPIGVVMAYVLVHVINRRSFGWTLELSVSPIVLGQALLFATLAALLAGLYPAWRMSKIPPALALKES